MSSKFFSNRHETKVDPKVTTKNAPGSRTNVKKNTGIRKTGRGK
jgi:hypothetical protein